MDLCVLVPAYNEEQNLSYTIKNIYQTLSESNISHNILVVNDHSTDGSENVLENLCSVVPTLKYVNNAYGRGFGNALRYGLDHWQGDIVAIMMADTSDDPKDVIHYYREIDQRNVDCVFGSRFIKGGSAKSYPPAKLVCNRIFNSLLRLFVDRKLNDFTNAFKAYRRVVIEDCKPFTSENFSLTVEIPLKALKRGYTYSIVPISWTQRKHGFSKLSILKNTPSYFRIFRLYLTNKL